jgi:hypothetical protein
MSYREDAYKESNLSDAQIRWEILDDVVKHPKRTAAVKNWRKDRDFYFSSQWEDKEAVDLKETGQIDVVFNRIRRAFRNFISDIATSKPTIKFMPVDPIVVNNEKLESIVNGTVRVLQGLWDYTWRCSHGVTRMRRSSSNQLISGLGWFGIHLDENADYGRGEIKFRSAFPWEVIVDLSSSEPDFSDSPFMAYRILKSYHEIVKDIKDEELKKRIKEEACFITDEMDADAAMVAPDMEKPDNVSIEEDESNYNVKSLVVQYIEWEEIVDVDVKIYKVRNPFSVLEEHVFESDDDYYDEKTYREFLSGQVGYEFVGEPLETTDKRCKLTRQIGRNVELDSEILPIRGFRWVPFVGEDTENPLPMGEVYFNRPLQKLLNKMFSLVVLSAQTTGTSAKIIGLNGSLGDSPQKVKAFQNLWANPVAAVQLENTRGDKTIDQLIKVVPAAQMPPALSNILGMVINEMNDEMSYHPAQSGVFKDLPRTAEATRDVLSKADINIRIPILNIELAMQIISQRWLEYCTAHYDYYKAFAAQGSNYDMDTFFLNSGQDEEGLINNISLLKWHVFVSLGTSLQNQKSAILKMFQDLMQVNPLFIKLFLKYSDLPDRFDIIKEVDYTQNLEREYQQLQQVVPTLQKQIEALSRTVQDEKFKVELAKFSGQLQNVLTKLRANDKIRDNEVQAAISGIGNMQLQGEQNGA